ncbi:MAG: YebC/PmpR family DNA-binding transcriptional regulator [Deltaproteobacteria bacterium]|nr:YebC/PmpR family DNA-binding transcriptional regulator [Deltaproteobacteria bacterium]MBW1909117.1 YebC/PmpR family DNA-binding transcriptional regulator [Deltaproteobacteria bacterium]MBW2115012.1 YebC/PmpR family DNA-binding transcriptional regulator [Deltaproteobacteria bacterium]MBW2167879.1 YebC/PmpR family DNA-binding transcriptional regulator [Deltaproteobacteria bacterium]MBW2357556.1 YebC/PmpR family DNA-binding transcriptional regulator [Deltaproteobacteria bacterium]
MSGHSKWSSIKHKKGAADARRGKIFSKLIKEVTVASRLGGGDPDGNPRLRTAISAAKAENMPKDNIERAIKKGTGELEGVAYEEASYEGYGPGGVAVLVDCLTDNKNRAVADVKHLFERNGGALGEPGCVAWIFEQKGLIVFDRDKVDEEQLLELALEAGAEDIREEETEFDVITDPSDFELVKKAVDDAGLSYTLSEVTMIPKNTVKVEGKKAQQMVNLMQALEDNDDVSNVYANFDISDEVLEALS